MIKHYRVLFVLFVFCLGACARAVPQPEVQPVSPQRVEAPSLQPPAATPAPVPEMKFRAVQSREVRAPSHVGPDALYPDHAKTAGLADTLDVSDLTKRYSDHCPAHKETCTYSQDHRDVSKAVHDQVYDEYNVPAGERNIQHGEIDHFWPLCAGGSNKLDNLWYQPKENEWNGENLGFKEKDWLEAEICKEIVAGELEPEEAYKKLTTDWVAYYHEKLKESHEKIVDQDDN
jgi:hypothetical protein